MTSGGNNILTIFLKITWPDFVQFKHHRQSIQHRKFKSGSRNSMQEKRAEKFWYQKHGYIE